MAKKKDDIDLYFDYLSKNLFNSQDLDFPNYFKEAFDAGDTTLYQKNISETKIFDDEWIKTLESYFPSIDKITRNPRVGIKYDENITDIERAKKINAKSVRHLASHTQFLKNVDEEKAEITPKKILTTQTDTEYDIYENRFIATLINRMFLFVRSRLEVIRSNVESFQKDHFAIDSNFKICDDEVTIKYDLTIKKDLDNKTINEYNYQLLERVEKLAGLIDGVRNSQFMKIMKKCKPVYPPIMKTNVILKNPDFKNAYTLWLFFDKYSTLGYDVQVEEKDLELDTKFKNYIDRLMMVNYGTILSNQIRRERKYSQVEAETYLKKRKKVIKKSLKELSDDAKDLDMEDNTLNEYFLNKYKKIFNQSVNELEEKGLVKHDDALKKTIRKTTDIVNGIFESIFRLEEENDVFKKLRAREDIDKDYETKKEQLKFAKMIREVKAQDYKKMVKLEKKLISDLQKINNRYIKEKMAKKAREKAPVDIAKLEVEIKNIKDQNKVLKSRLTELKNYEVLTQTETESIKTSREQEIIRAKEELKAYEIELKNKYLEARALARKNYKEEMAQLAKTQKEEKKIMKQRILNLEKQVNKDKELTISKLLKEKQQLQKEYDEMIVQDQTKIDKKREKFLENNRIYESVLEKAHEQEVVKVLKSSKKEIAEVQKEVNKLKEKINSK